MQYRDKSAETPLIEPKTKQHPTNLGNLKELGDQAAQMLRLWEASLQLYD